MSRSYKKNPGWTCGSRGRRHCNVAITTWSKKQANRKVRHSKISANGGWYKTMYESWNIQDYRHVYEAGFKDIYHFAKYLEAKGKYPFSRHILGVSIYSRQTFNKQEAFKIVRRMWFK